jgi:hypothetical protein
VREQRVLDERALVDQPADTVANGQLALLDRLLAMALGPAQAGAIDRVAKVLAQSPSSVGTGFSPE